MSARREAPGKLPGRQGVGPTGRRFWRCTDCEDGELVFSASRTRATCTNPRCGTDWTGDPPEGAEGEGSA